MSTCFVFILYNLNKNVSDGETKLNRFGDAIERVACLCVGEVLFSEYLRRCSVTCEVVG